MSKTPVDTSGLVNVSVASHLSKVPWIATDAFTKNLIELSAGVITKTGTWARVTDGSTANAKTQRIVNGMRMVHTVRLSHFIVNRKLEFCIVAPCRSWHP